MLRQATIQTLKATQTRSLHTAVALCVAPKSKPYDKYRPQKYNPTEGLEKVAFQYAGNNLNYNQSLFGPAGQPALNDANNFEFTMRLLQQQLKAAGSSGKNVMISPITLAKATASNEGALKALKLSPAAIKRTQAVDYQALIEELSKSGDVSLNITQALAGQSAGDAFASSVTSQLQQEQQLEVTQLSHLVKLPFPLNLTPEQQAKQAEPPVPYTIHSNPALNKTPSTPKSAPLTHALNFTGYLAPKFTSPDTRYPNYFYDYQGEKTVAHMMVKTAKIWYVEHEKFQMLDLPYLNPNFTATLVLPRVTSDRTILDHPDEFAYDQSPRRGSTVHELLELFAKPASNGSDLFSHHAKYMTQMPGLVGLPGFQADYQVDESSVTGKKASTPSVHRSVLSVSPHGLDVGAKTPRQRTKQANFTALFDHPFLFFLRSTQPKYPQILFAGVINQPFQRKDWATKFPLPEEWREYKEEIGREIKKLYSTVL